jgi:hypothetical protein
LESSVGWFDFSDDLLQQHESDIRTACRDLKDKSRRIRFAFGVLLLASQRFDEAERLLGQIPAGYKYYRAAQWARCTALLEVKRSEEARNALRRPVDEVLSRPLVKWAIPLVRARRLLELCDAIGPATDPIAALVFDEIDPEFGETPKAWIAFYETAMTHSCHRDSLFKALLVAIDKALGVAAISEVEQLLELANIVSDELDEAQHRRNAANLARLAQLIGKNRLAKDILSPLIDSGPRADLLGVFSAWVALMRNLGMAADADSKISVWHQALFGADERVRGLLAALAGTTATAMKSESEVDLIVPVGTRIALFGGHARQRERNTRSLELMGFAACDIDWRDADSGHGLQFADCKPLIDGNYTFYIVVTSCISHATSLPVVRALKQKGAIWEPLAIAGEVAFRQQMRGFLEEWLPKCSLRGAGDRKSNTKDFRHPP